MTPQQGRRVKIVILSGYEVFGRRLVRLLVTCHNWNYRRRFCRPSGRSWWLMPPVPSRTTAASASAPVLTAALLRTMAMRALRRCRPERDAGGGRRCRRAAEAASRWERSCLAESRRFIVTVPGWIPLSNLHFSLLDVADLALAGAVVAVVLHGAEPGGVWRAPPRHDPVGRGDGASILQSRHLLAEADDGAYIPTMAIEALIRKQLRCERPAPAAARCWQGRGGGAAGRRGGGLPPLIPRC